MGFMKFYRKNKALVIITIILIFCFAYYYYLHRHPRTDDAFVVANVRPVAAYVSGYITDIY